MTRRKQRPSAFFKLVTAPFWLPGDVQEIRRKYQTVQRARQIIRERPQNRACAICGHGFQVRSSYFLSKLPSQTTYFHQWCYKEILRGQHRRCLNCDVPLNNPKSSERIIQVVMDERRQMFCSQNCLETYQPLAGLAVSLPTETTCPYCNSVYPVSLTSCPSCGAARTRHTDIMSLSPYQFEQRVAELLIRMGYSNVSRVGGAGDRGVDITAQRKDEFGQPLRYAVQCKRYDISSRVGSTEMQVFCSMMSRVHGSDRGIYFTTSTFTTEAVEIARKFGVMLVDGKLLEELIAQYG